MFKFIRLALAVTLMLAMVNAAPAGQVTESTDSGKAGEMRRVVEAAVSGSTVTFAPGVHPVLTGGDAVNVKAGGISIKGNLPETVIARAPASAHPVLFMDMAGSDNGLSLENLAFQNIERQVGSVGTPGGGIIGTVNTSNGLGAALGNVLNSRFDGNVITLGNFLHGGGMLGTHSTSGPSSVGDVDASFSNNRVALTNTDVTSDSSSGKIWGGGLIGAYAENPRSPSIGNIKGEFIGNTVSAGTYINGGGLAGAFVGILPLISNDLHTARIGDVSADFINNRVTVNTNLSGGGLVGSWAWMGSVEIGGVSGTFEDNTVTTGSSYMRGGGIVGLRSYQGESVLGKVSASFLNNEIIVAASLGGGGIIGLYSAATLSGIRELDKTSTIAGIDGAGFIGNTTRVGRPDGRSVYALGGVAAVSGLNRELVVNNTIFRDNKLYITGQNVWDVGGGAFYIGTDRDSANPDGHVLTLTASDGMVTEFRNNSLQITENNSVTSRLNSITFSREWDDVNIGESKGILDSKADARLNVSPRTGGRVLLPDPVKVDMNNGRSFTMNVNGGGYFLWGGRNELFADKSALNFEAGVTELAPDFQALGKPAAGNFSVVIDGIRHLRIDTTGRAADMPMFHQPDSFTVTGTPLLEGVHYGPDFAAGKEWLITDRRHGVGAEDFTMSQNGRYRTSVRVEGDKLFLRVDKAGGGGCDTGAGALALALLGGAVVLRNMFAK
ncbi:MAG: hypothetical protein FWG71_06305 [Synergistaceae bacterium]|nr:hypothetical protein [Synergistaceae bacterium]